MNVDKIEKLIEKGTILIENNHDFVYGHSDDRWQEWLTVELELRENGIRKYGDVWHIMFDHFSRVINGSISA